MLSWCVLYKCFIGMFISYKYILNFEFSFRAFQYQSETIFHFDTSATSSQVITLFFIIFFFLLLLPLALTLGQCFFITFKANLLSCKKNLLCKIVTCAKLTHLVIFFPHSKVSLCIFVPSCNFVFIQISFLVQLSYFVQFFLCAILTRSRVLLPINYKQLNKFCNGE